MGQTLTHGIYLPDEGERNCYNGLAANWQILDTSVGTIAAHTAALSGKAPLVHTHTKSGVTDLLNSNFIPSANNTYDLGSSSYQWNNLYAKNYFYNGTAWGLDKANVWTDTNTFSSTLKQVNSTVTKGTNPQSDTIAFNAYWGGSGVSNLTNALFTRRGIVYADGSTAYIMYALENVSGGTHTSLSIKYDPNDTINSRYALMRGDFRPYYDNSFNLGISTHKWKSFNGVNPGALSLPNVNAVTGSSNTQLQDISGDLVQDQYGNCYFTPRMDGWAYIALNCSNATIQSGYSSYTVSVKTARGFANSIYTQSFTKNENAFSNVQIFIPVTANKEITLECTFTGFSVTKGYVIPCLGNV